MKSLTMIVGALALTGCVYVSSSEKPAIVQGPDYTWETEPVEPLPATAQQRNTFGILVDYVGRTLRGAPLGDDPEAKADIQSWSWALNGAAIKLSHAIEDGSYGGDTYIYKDAASGELVYVYITNVGFRTNGIVTLNPDGSFSSEEVVEGHPTITAVRATTVLGEGFTSTMTSEYLDNGTWVEGSGFTYTPIDEALPKLMRPSE